jgi:hypothetical protein
MLASANIAFGRGVFIYFSVCSTVFLDYISAHHPVAPIAL